MEKLLIVGGVAGGASVAARVRRQDEFVEIVMFERGPNVSFSNCALPFHLSGMIEDSDSLVLMDPEQFRKQYNIEARVNTEVMKINREDKSVLVKNLLTGEEYTEKYDRLVLSPGANPILPKSIEGIDGENVFTVRNVVDIKKLQGYLVENDIQDVAVVGAGYIGSEVAENLRLAGRNVSLIEALNQVMNPLDYDMAQILHKEMMDKGINLILSDGVTKITESEVFLASGKSVKAKAVVMSIGVSPETTLAREAGIEIGRTGAIKVYPNYKTNDENIYAVGDAIEVFSAVTHKPCRLALAGPAQKQARAAADHMYNITHENKGIIGSSVVQVFEMNAASTGLNEKMAKAEGYSYDFVYVIPGDKVGLMPDSNPMHFKLLFEVPTGRILGAQAVGKGTVDKRVDVIATLITMGGTLEDLKDLELTYAPLFGTAKDVVNFAALVGLNILYKKFEQVPVTKVRELVEEKACIIDVREKHEFENGHLINAVNIPLSELRDRLDEVPKDKPVYLHCRSSHRSYNAVMALQNRGWDNVFNISGSYLGICLYEYYTDVVTGREKIVTKYNFN
ncbi:MAG: FAD-dependent oxidoreductase [Clostridium sp.]|nr:FAD-dependent oxidoreductase [Clostridium sp.]